MLEAHYTLNCFSQQHYRLLQRKSHQRTFLIYCRQASSPIDQKSHDSSQRIMCAVKSLVMGLLSTGLLGSPQSRLWQPFYSSAFHPYEDNPKIFVASSTDTPGIPSFTPHFLWGPTIVFSPTRSLYRMFLTERYWTTGEDSLDFVRVAPTLDSINGMYLNYFLKFLKISHISMDARRWTVVSSGCLHFKLRRTCTFSLALQAVGAELYMMTTMLGGLGPSI